MSTPGLKTDIATMNHHRKWINADHELCPGERGGTGAVLSSARFTIYLANIWVNTAVWAFHCSKYVLQLCSRVCDVLMESSGLQQDMTVWNESSVEPFRLALFQMAKTMLRGREATSGLFSSTRYDLTCWWMLYFAKAIPHIAAHTHTHVPDSCLRSASRAVCVWQSCCCCHLLISGDWQHGACVTQALLM